MSELEINQPKLTDFPKLYCPFIRQTFKVNVEQWKKHGSRLQLREPLAYLVVNRINPGYEWVFEDPETIAVEKECYCNAVISSSRIREEVEHGSITKVNEMLMEPYTIYGEVVHGRKLGRTLGMPTVNQIPESDKLLPPNGVYFSRVRCNSKWYDGITNIGCKPTVSGDEIRGVETYIYDFHEDVYGNSIWASLLEFQRPEQRFPTVDTLQKQMQKDIETGRAWHAKNHEI